MIEIVDTIMLILAKALIFGTPEEKQMVYNIFGQAIEYEDKYGLS